MSRGPGKIQTSLVTMLRVFRTIEPWPVWCTAFGLTRLIYATEQPTAAQIESVRRACHTAKDLETTQLLIDVPSEYSLADSGSVQRYMLVVRSIPTDTQQWLWEAYLSAVPSRFIPAANVAGYVPPTRARLAAGIEKFAIDYPPSPEALQAASAFCGTEYGPKDRQRWQQSKDERERKLAENQARWRAAATASRVRFGPYVLDAATAVEYCPCCRQPVDDITWDAMSHRAQPA